MVELPLLSPRSLDDELTENPGCGTRIKIGIQRDSTSKAFGSKSRSISFCPTFRFFDSKCGEVFLDVYMVCISRVVGFLGYPSSRSPMNGRLINSADQLFDFASHPIPWSNGALGPVSWDHVTLADSISGKSSDAGPVSLHDANDAGLMAPAAACRGPCAADGHRWVLETLGPKATRAAGLHPATTSWPNKYEDLWLRPSPTSFESGNHFLW